MATTATMPTATDRPPGWGTRYGVFFRRNPAAKWELVSHAGSREGAVELMHRLTSSGPSGDWIVRPLNNPPEDRRMGRSNPKTETTSR